MNISAASGWEPRFVFESTESMAEQLVEVLGQSGWKMIPNPTFSPGTKSPECPQPPKCRRFKICGNEAQWYGPVGGFSVMCKACNEEASRKRRARSAKKRINTKIPVDGSPAVG